MITAAWPNKDNKNAVPFVVRQVEFLKRQGVEVEVFYFRGAKNPFNYLKALINARRQISKGQFDLIHAQWGQSALPVLFSRLPLVITFRGSDLEGKLNEKGVYDWKSKILVSLSKFAARFAAKRIVVSRHMIRHFSNTKNIEVIPSGLDFSKIPLISKSDARKKCNFPDDKIIVLFPNNPKEFRKRIDLVEQTIDRSKNRERIQLEVVWGKSHETILEHMIGADFLIFTSMHEGSPNVIKEALACNLPIISVNVGDVLERIKGIDGCFVVEGYDPQDLADKLDEALEMNFTNYNSENLVRELDENLLTARLVSLYKSCVK